MSRGASFCIFIEKDAVAADIINKNLSTAGFTDNSAVFVCDVYGFLKTCDKTFDFIFMDPPYGKNLIPPAIKLICEKNLLRDGGCIVAETENNEVLPHDISKIVLSERRKYGKALLNFYKKI